MAYGKRGETTPAADLVRRANLWLRPETRPAPSRQHKAMTAQLTREGTQARTTEPATQPAAAPEACHRVHRTIQEMNYASRRVVELQAPWSVDKQWHWR